MSGPKKQRRVQVRAEPESPRRGLILAISLVLAVATVLAYASVRHHAFLLFDDSAYVTENGMVQSGLTAAGARWAFTTPYAGNWHPLTWISHMADVQLFGLEPGWHHVTNLFLHVLTTLLVFRLFLRMTGAIGASAFVAALFALHPLHVESVAWVAERKDVLSTLWWVLAVSAYVTFVRQPTALRYGAIVLCFLLALMSKPMVITLPFLLLLLDVWPLARWNVTNDRPDAKSTKALIIEKLPLFALALAMAVVTFFVQRQAGAVRSLDTLPVSLRIAKIPVAYVWYLVGTVWPVDLAALYPYPTAIPLWQSLGATLLLIAITVAAVRIVRSRPYVLVGWLWFIGTLVPVIGIVQAGAQPYADRFMYVPAIGLFAIVAFAAKDAIAARPALLRPVGALGIAVLAVFAVMSYRQLTYWKDSVTLWERAVAVTRNNYIAYTNLGFSLAEAGHRSDALGAYQEAIRLKPTYSNAHNYLGVLHAEMGNPDKSASELEEAIRLRPGFAEAHNNLGLARAEQNRLDDAVKSFKEALRLDPKFAPARNNLALAYIRQHRLELAIPELEQALREQPGSAESEMNLATALSDAGRHNDALAHFDSAARLGGDPVRVHSAWGEALMNLGDLPGALRHFTTALEIKPSFGPAVHNLGRTLVRSGRVDEGMQALQSAVRLEPDNADYHYELGEVLARRGMTTEAIAEMKAVLQLDPMHVKAQDALRLLIKK